jgi:NADPH:quinone reductase-like Zn-dependent oxidoreductase
VHAAVIADRRIGWTEYPDPVPEGAELLVRVQGAGINGADIAQRAGFYPPPAGAPADVPGLELAGVVEAVGGRVLRFSPGDKVMALVGGGGQAELCLVDERLAMPVPEQLDWLAAGALPEAFATAHDAVFTQCELRSGERLLVTGAAGGVGLAAVQLGLAAGAEVVASVRRPEHRGALSGLGATAVAPEEVPEAGPYDVVLELVGAPSLLAALPALNPWGRIVVIGFMGGHLAELDLRLLAHRRARLYASTLRARPLEERAEVLRRLERHVLPLVERGRVEVRLDASFAFAEVEAAYERFAGGGKLGKIVLHP